MNALKIINVFASSCYSPFYVQFGKLSSRAGIGPIPLRPKKPKSVQSVSEYFVDSKIVEVQGGKGGDGCISFLQIKCNDKAGPDGGDGGNGGHVLFKTSSAVKDLKIIGKKINAANGERGFNKDCCGKNAPHEYVKVPVGTIVRNQEGIIIADLNEEGTMFVAARGGAGGRGNHFFATDTVQTPVVAELGAQGEKRTYILEVKSMAHIGLVGMPNAGKSTLLRAISRARPKVAPYAFTTLKPFIGMVQYNDYVQVAVADLPGLVEGSHQNRGLGIEFLKHAERCKGLLFLIDLSVNNPLEQYETLRYEISKFSEELNKRPFALIGNKLDLTEAKINFTNVQAETDLPIIGISAKTGKNLTELLKKIREMHDLDLKENADDDDDD